jgi:hypothetical protein
MKAITKYGLITYADTKQLVLLQKGRLDLVTSDEKDRWVPRDELEKRILAAVALRRKAPIRLTGEGRSVSVSAERDVLRYRNPNGESLDVTVWLNENWGHLA